MSIAVTVVAPAEPRRAWRRWSDVAAWPEWNPACVEATVEGEPGIGAPLQLRLLHPRGRPFLTRPRISAWQEGRLFAWEVRALGVRSVTNSHFAAEGEGTRINITVETGGAMAFTYRMTMTDRVQAMMYTAMLDALVEDLRP